MPRHGRDSLRGANKPIEWKSPPGARDYAYFNHRSTSTRVVDARAFMRRVDTRSV